MYRYLIRFQYTFTSVKINNLCQNMVNIGLNGFNRIGRLFLRIALKTQCGTEQKSVGSTLPKVVIVNDPNISPVTMSYLLRHDTFQENFNREIIDMNNCLIIDGQRIEAVQEKDVTKIPWHKACTIEYVVDTTGRNITCNSASQHIQEKIKCVLVTGCADIPIFTMGVNHTCYKPLMKTASVGTPSLNCLTAMLKVLHENFGVERAMATVIHPLSNDDMLLDDNAKSCRESRSALVNFMPAKCQEGRYVARIMPDMEGRVGVSALKVPVACVGGLDLTVCLRKQVAYEILTGKFKEAADCYMRGLLKCSNEELVSSDLIGNAHACIIDVKAGSGLSPCMVKLFAWYDAEYACAQRLYDMVKYIASREVCQ
ncbi:unnamed protein product [Ceutorhynchus assimilis]|uniref:Glyceraldehyde 3-phosphate dehydrogenase NAD(P) binding domain-containing protein n=1 Tax=Ceutorhynchus assimilis TaxID=467358 RepID=A0A9N9MJZ5_9CUCU|nr:unnamed protein product [Ceutorhynchus assimilis]